MARTVNSIERRINRILVVMDACHQNKETLERASVLAEHVQAELIALFVEDENLLNLARLPFAREVHRSSATEGKLNAGQISRTLRRQVEKLRDMVSQSAEKRKLQTSVKVVQGRFIHTAIAAAVETDVAFLNELTEPSSVLPHPFKFANTAASIGKPVWSVFDGSAESVRALRLALKLSVLENVELMLLLAAATPAQLPGLRRKAKRIAGESGVMVRFTLLTEGEFNNLPGLIQTQGCSLLVLARDNALFAATSVRFLDNIICPVVLMN